mgnify:CR=1 FL=1
MQRIDLTPAWLLDARPYSDTSALVEMFSAEHGRLSLIAKGARTQKSPWRGLLQPLQPLLLAWRINGEVGTLTGAELRGSAITLTGDTYWAAQYVHELLIRLLPRYEPHTLIYTRYDALLQQLCVVQDVRPALRHFELFLLQALGYALNLHTTLDDEPVLPQGYYRWREQGLLTCIASHPHALAGAHVLAMAQTLDDAQNLTWLGDDAILKTAQQLLRHAIDEKIGIPPLRTPQLLRELRQLRTV